MWQGVSFALAAGLMWGLVFVGPILLPDYPASLLAFGRYLAFGLIAVVLAWFDRRNLTSLSRADWQSAFKLALVGNFIYYICLASAIQRSGAPLPTMIIGSLPVLISICANLRNGQRDGTLPWRRLFPALAMILLGLVCVNQVELQRLLQQQYDVVRYATGVLFAIAALICWTWYPLSNADWLRAHPQRNPRTWATAQGLVGLPISLIGYALIWAYASMSPGEFAMPLGPTPGRFVLLMLAIGLLASWLGTLCWNEASQRLPTALVGQLIVFETLAALCYAYLLRGVLPEYLTLAGIACLLLGVWGAIRIKPVKHPIQPVS